MKIIRCLKQWLTAASLAAVFMLLLAPGATADGAPAIPDTVLWSSIRENQQIAVVRIDENSRVKVDLFVSMLDNTGESHRITYFVPLGTSPSDFQAIETTSINFDMNVTSQLDARLKQESRRKGNTQLSWLPGTVFTHGIWMLPGLVPLVLSGCGSATPEATFETRSSQIGIYGLDTQTDISELIEITGLDPSVQETLERLRGQRIAVINLNTQPATATAGGSSYSYQGQPGLHLSWGSPTTAGSDSKTIFTYPLGTGAAWSKPIEMTRVYVVAPKAINFDVRYPGLGTRYPGTAIEVFGLRSGGIHGHYNEPAYVIEETANSGDRVWRITYTQSNSAEDIIITVNSSGSITSWLGASFPWRIPFQYTILISMLLAVIIWVTAWRYIIPHRLAMEYKWSSPRLWSDALIYPGLNLVLTLAAIPLIVISLFIMGPLVVIVIIGLSILLLWLPAWLFIRKFHVISSQPKVKLFITYIFVVLAANAAYLASGAIYAALTGTL